MAADFFVRITVTGPDDDAREACARALDPLAECCPRVDSWALLRERGVVDAGDGRTFVVVEEEEATDEAPPAQPQRRALSRSRMLAGLRSLRDLLRDGAVTSGEGIEEAAAVDTALRILARRGGGR